MDFKGIFAYLLVNMLLYGVKSMKIRNIMLMELPYLLKTYSRSHDERIMREYFSQCCLSIYEHPECIEYYKIVLRSLLTRHISNKSWLRKVERIIKFCCKYPKQAALYAKCSETLEIMVKPTKKDILAVSSTVL